MSEKFSIVLTFGVWDMLHVGHLRFLERASALGDSLVVAVPSDLVVIEDKRQAPVIPARDRRAMLSALRCVGQTVLYDELDFVQTLERVQPDVLAVGGDWGRLKRHRDAERWVLSRGGRVKRVRRYHGESTSLIRQRVMRAAR